MKIKILSLFIFIFLSGCASTLQERVVTSTSVKVIKIPESLMIPCIVSTPPNRDSYLLFNYQEKEVILTNYILDLHTDLKVCNIKLSKIKEFQTKEIENINSIKNSE